MFTRRRSRGFLLEDTVNRGAEFLETLKTVYPKADALHEKDFDWLFDCPKTAQFLDWFCNTVGEENVLSPGEVEAYEALLSSGKPVLEGEALVQVLKTCRQCPQLKGATSEDEVLPLEALEREAQALHSQHACRLQRLNKLQSRSAGLKQELCHLASKKERVGQELRKTQLDLEMENSQTNDVLSQACKATSQLVEWYQDAGNGSLMSQADLGHYMELEELASGALMAFIQKALLGTTHAPEPEGAGLQGGKSQGGPQEKLDTQAMAGLAQTGLPEKHVPDPEVGVETQEELGRWTMAGLHQKALPEEVSSPKAEAALLEALHAQDGCQETAQGRAEVAHIMLLESMGSPEAKLPESQEELERMELAYICSHKELITTSAEVEGIWSGLQWAERTLKTMKDDKMVEDEDELRLRLPIFQERLRTIQRDIGQIQTQHLMPLFQAHARLVRLPVLWVQLDWEAAHLESTTSKQEEIAGQLMAQHSRLELLVLQLKLEKKQQQQMGTFLEEMVDALHNTSANLQRRLARFEDSSLYIKICPRTLIDPSNLTTIRLWEMLEKQGQEKQLFRTCETLASRGSCLCQERRMLEVQLAESPSQIHMLESDNEMLYRMMYSDSNQLLLNAQELADPMEQLYATQAKLYQMLMDLLSELKAKRKTLQSHFQQTERHLYVHFFRDARQLEEVVQQLEEQSLAASEGPVMEQPHPAPKGVGQGGFC